MLASEMATKLNRLIERYGDKELHVFVGHKVYSSSDAALTGNTHSILRVEAVASELGEDPYAMQIVALEKKEVTV
jgi:hypothetical protein